MGSYESKSSCGTKADSEKDIQLQNQLGRIRHKLLVMSGKGGVGKSSVAAALSLGLSKLGNRVGLLDVDLHGPSIPHMFGMSGPFEIGEKKRIIPHRYNSHLKVVSVEYLLDDRDSPIIWRGPIKHGVIKQFIYDVDWGDLDYLVIDSPPGTGDEPLSVAQTVLDAKAIIVTTPQELALADVRKSINFCRNVNMTILGLVENMSGYVCPHCHQELPLFGKGGGARTAGRMNVRLLGRLPFDPLVVNAGDVGWPAFDRPDENSFIGALANLVSEVVASCSQSASDPVITRRAEQFAIVDTSGANHFRAAIPLAEGVPTNRFGDCEQFALLDVCNGRIERKELITPPPHDPGALPRWIGEQQVNLVIAGGMGKKVLELFEEWNIRVITGAPNLSPEELIEHYIAGKLETGEKVFSH